MCVYCSSKIKQLLVEPDFEFKSIIGEKIS